MRFARLTVLLVILAALAGCTLAGEPEPAGPIETGPLPGESSNLVPAAMPDAANGAVIYSQSCVRCHGDLGKGDGEFGATLAQQGITPPDFSNPATLASLSPERVFRIVTAGNIEKLMPPFNEALSDQQRWDVAYYVYSFSTPQEVLDQGKTLYEGLCIDCHSADGSQNGLNDFARMAALDELTLIQQFIQSSSDSNHSFSDLAAADAHALAVYARTFAHKPAAASVAEQPTPTAQPTATLPPTEAPTGEVTPGATEASTEAATEAPTIQPTPEITPTPGPAAFGTVSGRIVNGTVGAGVPGGLEITLRGLQVDSSTGGMNEFINQKGTLAADGSFSFGNVPFDKPGSGYVVQVIYNGVEFINGNAIDPASATLDLPITVYEATNDPSVVTLDSHHILIREHPDALVVIEVFAFSNLSDKVYVTAEPVAGGKLGSVSFSIPSDAYGIQFDGGEIGGRFAQSGETIIDTEPVNPGTSSHSISVSYILPFDGSRDLSLANTYQTTQINVLSAEGLNVSGAGLVNTGTSSFDGTAYTKWNANNLAAGTSLALKIDRQIALTDGLRTALSVALGVLVIATVAFWVMRGRIEREPEDEGIGGAEQETLLRQIGDLDEAFNEGRINRFDYEAQRAALKADLADLMEE